MDKLTKLEELMEANLKKHPLCTKSQPKHAVALDIRSLGRPLNAAKLHLSQYFTNGVKALEQRLCAMTRRNDCMVSLLRFGLEPMAQESYNDDIVYFKHGRFAGTVAVSAQQNLINQIADAYYGGTPSFTEQEAAPMNASELRVQARLGATVLSQLCSDWHTTNSASGIEGSVLYAVYAVQIGQLYGEVSLQIDDNLMLSLAMPAASHTLNSEHFKPLLSSQLKRTPVSLHATLSKQVLPLSQVLTLKEGDIIGADIQEELTVCAGPLPLYKAKIAEKNNHLVLKVTDHITPSERT
ncbi:FliM/FliN family flagellar motor switch protein [Thaumasiovibrio sp. DFM-14]|uniref:FliM/FliN family flagellar motor switch protein n=1 Tax=Thaumasiovibrio sp. DFM-14 TaxID=3384792 RepID=UPI0039A3F396